MTLFQAKVWNWHIVTTTLHHWPKKVRLPNLEVRDEEGILAQVEAMARVGKQEKGEE